jgi:molybdopterin converting factor small subunit
MKVVVFGMMKDYFEAEFELNQVPPNISELYQVLERQNPNASELLKKCRFAVNNTFVAMTESLENVQEVLVMPPSSGG